MTGLRSGQLIRYPYLWARQRDVGETEGRKHRPCCLVVPRPNPASGRTVLFLLPVSTLAPGSGQRAVEIPEIERRRAGLVSWKSGWVYISEFNYDLAESSFYFEPGAEPLGAFSQAFLKSVLAEFRIILTERRASKVDRTGD
jgi:hypothetical protein